MCLSEFQVIATLALFLNPMERLCSRYSDGCRPWPYHQDLYLQGILKVIFCVHQLKFLTGS